MDFATSLREMLWNRVGADRPFANRKRMADALHIDPSQLNRFMDGERGLSVESLGRVLEGLGARVVLPDDPGGAEAREVRFVTAQGEAGAASPPPIAAEDYVAVPVVSEAVAGEPGGIAEDRILGWALISRRHESVRFRSDLAAVTIGPSGAAMAPVLHPGDIVLVDRADRAPEPAGRLMLVRGRDGSCAVRRVASRPIENDVELVFYASDARTTPPSVRRLKRDLGGRLAEAILGRVVWAWSDMTLK